jgi:hypothetical protein
MHCSIGRRTVARRSGAWRLGVRSRLVCAVFLCINALLPSFPLNAFEYAPWFPEPLLPQLLLGYELRAFPRVATSHHSLHRSETAHTGFGRLEFAATDELYLQTEVALTGTTTHGFFFDDAALDLQYMLCNDIIGDPFSLVVGGSLIVPSTTSRRDFATYHLGSVDFQAHVAIGKETSFRAFWVRRVWAAAGLLCSTRGAPQLWGRAALAYNWHDCRWAELFLIGRYGFGHRELSAFVPFSGYGPYACRAVDIGGRLYLQLRWLGEGGIEYRYRLFARNYPASAHTFCITLLIPLGF